MSYAALNELRLNGGLGERAVNENEIERAYVCVRRVESIWGY